MREIATITRQNISFKRNEVKYLNTKNSNFLKSSIEFTLNTIEIVSYIIKGDTYERKCFVVTFPNGEKEIFPYTNEDDDINHSHFGTIQYNESLQKAINYALSKKFNVDSKYISLFYSRKIHQLILKR